MKNLKKTTVPKIIECYELGDWKATIVQAIDTIDEQPLYEYYLTGNSITSYMFGVPKAMLAVSGQTLEEIMITNLPDYIASFKEEFDPCDELENPFEED